MARVVIVCAGARERARLAGDLREHLDGVEVVEAAGAADLSPILEAGAPGAVVTDHGARGLDGLEVLRLVRAAWPECPVVIRGRGVKTAGAPLELAEGVTWLPGSSSPGPVVRATLESGHEGRVGHRRFFDELPVGLFVLAPDGRFLDANRALVDLLGYPDREALQAADPAAVWLDAVNGETWRVRAERPGLVRGAEVTLRRRDGATLRGRLDARRIDHAGPPGPRWEGSLADVTVRRSAEAALRQSQRLLAAVLHSARDAVITTDADQGIVLFNPAAELLFGVPSDEALGSPLGRFVPARLREAHHRLVEAFGTDGVSSRSMAVGRPVWGLRADGREFPAEASISQARIGDHRFYTVILRDISERLQAEEALRDSEARFRSAFDDSATGMALQHLDGRYFRVNAAYARLLGVSPEALLGQDLGAAGLPAAAALHAEGLQRLAAGQPGGYQQELHHVRPDGQTVWGVMTVSLVRDREGRPAYAVTQVQDVTERKRAEAEVARQREALLQREKLTAMADLLAGVAHELNNPLSVIIGQAELLRTVPTGPRVADRAAKVAMAADRCARIIRNFLAMARQHPRQREPTLLNRVVHEALEILAYALRVDSVEVVLELAPSLPSLWADPHQLHQVVVNLVSNAHQAMRGAPGPRRVTLRTSALAGAGGHGEGVVLEVDDTGPGVPEALRGRIFDPFFTTRPAGQGTGLGLPLCQGIVENHGGIIELVSGSGEGARFRVELPLGSPAALEPVEEPPAGAGVPLAGRRILVVDDEPSVIDLLTQILTGAGCHVDSAADGTVALERLAAAPYDVVVSDVRMPRLDGPGLYQAACRRDPGLARRFVFLTGDTLGPEAAAFLQEMGPLSLAKPFAPLDVLRVVGRGLGGP